MSKENRQTIEQIYIEFGEKNFAAVLEIFSKDFEWIAADNSPLSDQSPYLGSDAIRDIVFARINAGFENLSIQIDEIFDVGEKVIVLGYYNGKLNGGTDSFQAQLAHVWTFNENKPAKFQQYVDTLKLFLEMKKMTG
ncbi:MAG: nuclear transport factor 2 family protein [Pyrinomonadaceae bacterium]